MPTPYPGGAPGLVAGHKGRSLGGGVGTEERGMDRAKLTAWSMEVGPSCLLWHLGLEETCWKALGPGGLIG